MPQKIERTIEAVLEGKRVQLFFSGMRTAAPGHPGQGRYEITATVGALDGQFLAVIEPKESFAADPETVVREVLDRLSQQGTGAFAKHQLTGWRP